MSAQCRHGLIRYECWQCRDEANQSTHVAHVFAGGLVTAVQQLEAKDAEMARLRSDLAAARALLRELRDEWLPDDPSYFGKSFTAWFASLMSRIDAALAGDREGAGKP